MHSINLLFSCISFLEIKIVKTWLNMINGNKLFLNFKLIVTLVKLKIESEFWSQSVRFKLCWSPFQVLLLLHFPVPACPVWSYSCFLLSKLTCLHWQDLILFFWLSLLTLQCWRSFQPNRRCSECRSISSRPGKIILHL